MHFDLPSGRAQFRWHGHQIQRSGTEGGKNFEISSLANRCPFTCQRRVGGKRRAGKKVGVNSEPQRGQNTPLVREKLELLPACSSGVTFPLKIQLRNRGKALFFANSSAQIGEVRGCGSVCADAARLPVTSRLPSPGKVAQAAMRKGLTTRVGPGVRVVRTSGSRQLMATECKSRQDR